MAFSNTLTVNYTHPTPHQEGSFSSVITPKTENGQDKSSEDLRKTWDIYFAWGKGIINTFSVVSGSVFLDSSLKKKSLLLPL